MATQEHPNDRRDRALRIIATDTLRMDLDTSAPQKIRNVSATLTYQAIDFALKQAYNSGRNHGYDDGYRAAIEAKERLAIERDKARRYLDTMIERARHTIESMRRNAVPGDTDFI